VSKRAPTNARYQKYQEPAGKTRKSAAAAKPSRKATGTSAGATKAKTPSGRGRARLDPQTPEFKALRKQWWMFLLAGVVLVTASWGVRYIDKPGGILGAAGQLTVGSTGMTWAGLLASLTLGLAYACIFYALYLDFAKMRPMRAAAAKGDKAADKPAKPTAKPAKSTSEDSSTD
jgi:hypothetical protein